MGSLTTNVTDVTHEAPDIIEALREAFEKGRKELTQREQVARTFYLRTSFSMQPDPEDELEENPNILQGEK